MGSIKLVGGIMTRVCVCEHESPMKSEMQKASPSRLDSQHLHNGVNIWTIVWRLALSERLKIFLWKCVRGILPVKLNLCSRLHHLSPTCPLCLCEDESLEHLFFSCPVTQPLWTTSTFRIPTQPSCFKTWLLDGIICLTASPHEQDRFFNYIGMLWAIWKSRNATVFSGESFTPGIAQALATDNALWFKRSSLWNTSALRRPAQPSPRLPPPPSFVIQPYPPFILLDQRVAHITVDGAWKEGSSKSGLGFQAYDPNGNIIQQCSVSCCSSTPLQTELMALLLAVTWALHHHFNVIFLYSDCLNAILQLAGRSEPHYADVFLLHNLRQELSKLDFCRLSKVDRKDAHPAHCLAKRALQSSSTFPAARGIPFWTGATTGHFFLFI
ncbi:uncharacterized protein LOC131309596 [Rhododendron vialii]|uniref:uncharacterized protein LOC131309596 n=1 Tax=Rhododendron vialii TaxID=182163 RepID=UPI00265FDA51|nr:uncharacterized protein LOC131309596 [Rhododendron vialii]